MCYDNVESKIVNPSQIAEERTVPSWNLGLEDVVEAKSKGRLGMK